MNDKAVVLIVIAAILGIMETACIIRGDNSNLLPVAGIIGGLMGYMLKEPVDRTGSAMKAMMGFCIKS